MHRNRVEGHIRSKNRGKWNNAMALDGGVSVITRQMGDCRTTWNGDE